MDMSSKPNFGGRGVAMPGLPSRPSQQDDIPAEQSVNVPPPPHQPRSPSPPTPTEMRSSSPIRVAMPVGRSQPTDIEPPEDNSQPPVPTESIAKAAAEARNISPEPQIEAHEPARGASEAAAASTFGGAASGGGAAGGPQALAQYDYEKAEENEIELREGEYITNIDMVDPDWWLGTNSRGETGLFPSNFVELDDGTSGGGGTAGGGPAAEEQQEEEEQEEEEPQQAVPDQSHIARLPTATAQYDYEAAEENEIGFPEGATIIGIVRTHPSDLNNPNSTFC